MCLLKTRSLLTLAISALMIASQAIATQFVSGAWDISQDRHPDLGTVFASSCYDSHIGNYICLTVGCKDDRLALFFFFTGGLDTGVRVGAQLPANVSIDGSRTPIRMTRLPPSEKYSFSELFHAPLRRSGGLLDELMAGSNVTLTLQGETDWTFTLRNSRSTINQVKLSCGASSPASRQQDRAEVSPPAPAKGPLPQLVQAHLDEMDGMCKDSGGRLKGTDRALLTADFNRDGQTDYAIAHGALMCTNFASMFTGSGGSNVTVFVSGPSGYREVLSRGSYGVRVEGRKLWLGLAGPACGYPKTAKSEARSCERAMTWNNARRQMEFTDIIHGRP